MTLDADSINTLAGLLIPRTEERSRFPIRTKTPVNRWETLASPRRPVDAVTACLISFPAEAANENSEAFSRVRANVSLLIT